MLNSSTKQQLARREWDQVIVANRAPTNFIWQEGLWQPQQATNALSLMLEPLVRRPNVSWYCCVSEPPGASGARDELFATAQNQSDMNLQIIPVPLPAPVYDAYYGQVCNEILWMLQHGLIGPGGYEFLDAEHYRAWEEGYEFVNRQLATSISESVNSTEAFIIYDYHLYLLPSLLRQTFPRTPILHFTHIPFPQVPALKLLPSKWRQSILLGLLGANIVGFQTEADVQGFIACCKELLKTQVDLDTKTVQAPDGRWVRVRAYPASVNPYELRQTMLSGKVVEARKRLSSYFVNQTIVRVDRLDPSKNQLIGFLAFAHLLEHRPDLRGRVRFLAFLVPSRSDLRIYQAYWNLLHQTVEQINDRFTEECSQPPIEIFYMNDREQALVAMEHCDVLLANSRSDGMNLVAKEWAIVSQQPGALVLSEMAGVATEATDAALFVSPLDIVGTSEVLAMALSISTDERKRRLENFQRKIESWTAADWLQSKLAELGFAAKDIVFDHD
jgi:trehalose 6-phosphate synthase